MQASVPELTDIAARAGIDLRALRRGSQEARHVRAIGAAGPAAGRARRPLRADLSQQLGHARQRRRPIAVAMQGRRSGLLRPDPRPEAARHARRNAGDLGRRIRPHDLFARPTDPRQLRPRSSSALLHDVDGRRRLASRARSTARPTIFPTTSSKTRSTSTISTPPCSRLLGFDHERFTFRYQGLDQKLTGVEPAKVIKELIA